MVEIFTTALEAVTNFNKYVFTPVMEQFSYLRCYNGNIQSLRDQVENLNNKRSDLQLQVDGAIGNAEVIGSDVKKWIQEVGKISAKKERIIQDAAQVQQGCFYGICPNIKLRYRLSREAKKTADDAQGLLQEAYKFIKISYPAVLEPIPIASVGIEVDSRKSKEDEIMKALKDDNVYVIALCGMGGIGKTTMARKIESKVREDKIFEKVVMAVVSRPLDLKNVQQGIAEGLGLKLFEQTNITVRAQRLHHRLEKMESVLIILDDVWEKFNLQEIGIPSKTTHQRCKIILTSRIQRVCRNIENSAKIILLDVLPEQEAWNLFKEKAGEIVDEPIARDVARECKGLPLALVTVATTLRDSSMPSWEDALHQLKASLATGISEVRNDLYVPLKWSYDQLQDEEARFLFLLCCLFPEDYEIRLHVLVEYAFTLGIFANTVTLEEARNRVCRLVDMLIDRFLLIRVVLIHNDHFMRYHVKMHDMIRDMAISIAYEDKHFMVMHDRNLKVWPKKDCYENYTCISLSSSNYISLPKKIYCPKLELLLLDSPGVEMQESSFDAMRGLKVLHTPLIRSLSWATNLRSLFLVNCELKHLPNGIGELGNLEILRLYGSEIEMLPMEIGRLKNLRLLEVTNCFSLKNIPPGVISGLVQLEELYMDTFYVWKNVEDTNASVAEIASLTNLTTLQLHVPGKSINLLQGTGNWHRLRRYYLVIGKRTNVMGCGNFDRCIIVNSDFRLHPLTSLVQELFDNAQAIELSESGSTEIANKLSRHEYKNVERLVLEYLDLEFLFDLHSWNLPNTGFLPRLTTLVMRRNPELKEICHGHPPTGSFSNLTSIELYSCSSLKNLFSFSVIAMLSKLEFLKIEWCININALFLEQNRQYGENVIITFPRLSKITVEDLPRLGAFFKATNQVAIEIPQLYELEIQSCPMLKIFRTIGSSSHPENDHHTQQQFLFDEKVMCRGLKKLTLTTSSIGIFDPRIPFDNFVGLESLYFYRCSGCVNLFSNSMSRGMHNLKYLYMQDFKILQEVIAKDQEEQTNSKVTLFPQLNKLKLSNLPKMQQFCHMSHGVEFPSLEVLEIRSCLAMEIFSRNQYNPACLQGSDSNSVVQSFFDEVTCNKLKALNLSHVKGVSELFNRKISTGNFSGFESVEISSCQRLKSIFSPRMFRGLVNLQVLKVSTCPLLQEVIFEDEKEDEANNVKETISPQLKWLELHDLPKLIRFCHIKNDLELPSLERLHVSSCHELKAFSLGSVHLPSSVRISAQNLGSVDGKLSKENFERQFLRGRANKRH